MTAELKEFPGKNMQLEVQVDEETAQGVYVNLALVNHTETEFVIDAAFVQPQSPQAKVRARLISSPKHTKRLMLALQENIRRFEDNHGEIHLGMSMSHEEFLQ